MLNRYFCVKYIAFYSPQHEARTGVRLRPLRCRYREVGEKCDSNFGGNGKKMWGKHAFYSILIRKTIKI